MCTSSVVYMTTAFLPGPHVNSGSLMPTPHVLIDPAILYFGTPVALLSTLDAEGRSNLAPMSSVFWLGHTAVLGMGTRSQTAANLESTGKVVINLPSVDQVDAIDLLALTTGRDPVHPRKEEAGYRHVTDKFAHAGLTPVRNSPDSPPRVRECPVALEGTVIAMTPLATGQPDEESGAAVFQIGITRVHVHESIRDAAHPDRVDPDRWRPLVMSFQKFYGLTRQVHPSRLATIDEEWYR
jgi:flavin reductase (DIM6/NTAB) family NADH-FMN oxidoreductase RutF